MIRLYGVTQGQGSLVRVTDGVRRALSSLGVLAGFVPVDAYDEDASYEGGEAAVGVLTAPPEHAWLMRAIGKHGSRLVLVPPNSTWVPEKLLAELNRQATGMVTPSKWAEGVLLAHAAEYGLTVSVWKHGVDDRFLPHEREAEQRRTDYGDGAFDVFHMSSTERERKGSRELIVAWAMALRKRWMGSRPRLILCADDPTGKLKQLLDDVAKGDNRILSSVAWTRSRMEYSVVEAAKNYRRYHVLCQPSRGEAFGMCLTEARSCGVPIVATDCTGHSEHVRQGDPGVVVVATGANAPIDDGPGASAPSLTPEAICEALGEAHADWLQLQEDAVVYAPSLARQWSWEEVTRQWLDAHPILSDWPKPRRSEAPG